MIAKMQSIHSLKLCRPALEKRRLLSATKAKSGRPESDPRLHHAKMLSLSRNLAHEADMSVSSVSQITRQIIKGFLHPKRIMYC